MRYLTIAFTIIVLSACKTGEGIDNEYSNLRTDGFYMGKSLFVSTAPDTINGIVVARDAVKMIRFYNLDSGVIIPESLPKNFKMNDSTTEKYYQWCQEFETKNPEDKNFVNFKVKLYDGDSIKFSQIAPNTKIDYVGKVYKDSIALKYILHPLGMGSSVSLPPKPMYFKFYPKSK